MALRSFDHKTFSIVDKSQLMMDLENVQFLKFESTKTKCLSCTRTSLCKPMFYIFSDGIAEYSSIEMKRFQDICRKYIRHT